MRSLGLRFLVALITACGPVASGTPTPSSLAAGAPCPVTTPPPIAVTPPPPIGSGPNPTLAFSAGPGTFLYGNDDLLVAVPSDGTLHPSDLQRGLAGGIKFGWWRVAHGDLVIEKRRLDASAGPVGPDAPSGYGVFGFQASSLSFPAAGCWQVSGTVGGTTTLTFVVNVADR